MRATALEKFDEGVVGDGAALVDEVGDLVFGEDAAEGIVISGIAFEIGDDEADVAVTEWILGRGRVTSSRIAWAAMRTSVSGSEHSQISSCGEASERGGC